MMLFSDYHFGMADNRLVHGVAGFYTVYDFSFFRFVVRIDQGHRFVIIGVERLADGFYSLYAILAQDKHKLVVHQFHSLLDGVYVCRFRPYSSMRVQSRLSRARSSW